MSALWRAGLALGFVADQLAPIPRPFSPGAAGHLAAEALEERLYADSRRRGVAYAGVVVAGAAVTGVLIQRRASSPLLRTAATAAVTWAVLGGRTAQLDATAIRRHLDDDKLNAARRGLSRMESMTGRETSPLAPSEVARATIESLAVTTSDAVVSPLLWGTVAGIPGLLVARAVGTAAGTIGRLHGRQDEFGWAIARLDDVIMLPGSLATGALTLVAVPHRALAVGRAWRADSWKHPRPNAGVAEATFAGALGVQLGGISHYAADRVQYRAILGDGDGDGAGPEKLLPAVRVARRVGVGALAFAMAVSYGLPTLHRWRRWRRERR